MNPQRSRGIISPPGLVLFGVDLETNVGSGWFVSLAMTVVIVVGGLLVYLGGPKPGVGGADAAPPRQKQSADGPSRPLS